MTSNKTNLFRRATQNLFKRLLAAFIARAIVVPDYTQWGNCYLVLRKVQDIGGIGILVRSRSDPDIIHIMWAEDIPCDVEVIHFEPNTRRYSWRAFLAAWWFEGHWVKETKKKMRIGHLHNPLSTVSFDAKIDALKVDN